MAPFNELLIGHRRKNDPTPISWSANLDKKFEEARKMFIKFTKLYYPNFNANMLLLTCNASDTAVGGVLEQLNAQGERQPLGLFNTKLNDSQRHWCTYDKKLFALYSSIEHFQSMIEGTNLILFTDHKPLLHAFKVKNRPKLECRSRQIEFISQFTTDIRLVSDANNVFADLLSRPEISAITRIVKLNTLAKAQLEDPEIQEF